MYQRGSPYGRPSYGRQYAPQAAGSAVNLLGLVLGITGIGFLITAVGVVSVPRHLVRRRASWR